MMGMTWRAALVSLLLFGLFVGVWHLATIGGGPAVTMDPEYAKLVGATASQGKSAMPGPAEVGLKIWQHLKDPFYDRGSNDKGLGIQLAYSIARVMTGYLIAVAVAIPIGFLIGMSPLMNRSLDPFIQVLKPISPLAWMPLALYTIKDSSLSSIFVIFICSLWPMLINTHARGRPLPPRLHHHPAGGSAHDPHRHANFHRHRVAGYRRGRNAGRGHRHRLFRVERMEQPLHHQRDHRDPGDRRRRHGARPDPRARDAASDVSGVRL
jgi:ABC-type nitrate/sulfonate/bicarbonate transport system permease component